MQATRHAALPRRAFLKISAATVALALTACAGDLLQPGASSVKGTTPEDAKLLDFFSKSFTRELEQSPEFMTQLGLKKRYGEWNDYSAEFALQAQRETRADLEFLRDQIDRNALSEPLRVSYDVFKFRNEQRVANHRFRLHNYDVSHFGGPHQNIPNLLINQHTIGDIAGAQAYVARIAATDKLMDQTIAFMRDAQAKGITLPRFSYALMIDDAKRVAMGAPFEGDGECNIYADFKAKLEKLNAGADVKAKLLADAQHALTQNLGPAYARFIAASAAIAKKVKSDHGVGTLPRGAAFYDERIANHTTLSLPAAKIHKLGLGEVARLSAEMETLKTKLGFRGSLKSFYEDLRSNPRYLYPTTDQGRADYMERARTLLGEAKASLPSVFGALPKAPVDVKRMEPFLEGGQTIAFYNSPTPDGSRPGYVFFNLASMAALPKWQMAALTFHEGIPGHHLQISIAQETKNIPDFRKYTFFTSYVEGWALYTEYLSTEMGLYKDTLDQVGRITMELWRACRLVVDTGIHAKGWSRRRSVAYFLANTALTRDNIVREIDRYFVYPGQACAYQIGKNKILELRERAKATLGPRFDIRGYHDTVLENGAVPLPVLETLVAQWTSKLAKPT